MTAPRCSTCGLAHEAAGQPSQASLVYQELISKYPDSIYAWALDLGMDIQGK